MKDVVSRCPIEEVMRLLSGRWPTLLLYFLKDGTKRFSDLKRDNPTLSHRMLALELRKLERAGVIRRTARAGYPLRVEYDLTPAGLRLVPLIDALGDWWEELQPAKSEALSGSPRYGDSTACTPGERFKIWYGRHDGPQVWGLLERQKSQEKNPTLR
jgi:DNA-binding HxlR family transcriptional regulator